MQLQTDARRSEPARPGLPDDLIVASASVDGTQNYVFQVKPEIVSETIAKEAQYWSVGGGTDTMLTLWNHKGEEQPALVTIYFDRGAYELPVRLKGQASAMFNISQVIAMQSPDVHGTVIPYDVHEGKITISSPLGLDQPMSIGVSLGTFNIKTATCGDPCQTCTGFSDLEIDSTPFGVPLYASMQSVATAIHQNGTKTDRTSAVTWSSENNNILSSQGGGTFSSSALGSATIDGVISMHGDYSYCEQVGACQVEQFDTPSYGNSGSSACTITFDLQVTRVPGTT